MSEIKERPILFSAPMVRAILEGRKTVTRRAMKIQPDEDASVTVESYNVAVTNRHGEQVAGPMVFGAWWRDGESGCKCPYGQPGDRLWVREAWASIRIAQAPDQEWVVYRESDNRTDYGGPWKPGIHMFRRDSRILLEITAVRAERLQDISEEQAKAEGCFFTDYGRKCGHTGKGWTDVGSCPAPDSTHQQLDGWMWEKTTSHEQCLGSARNAFGNLWTFTGGDWGANPWVWVVEFKRVAP